MNLAHADAGGSLASTPAIDVDAAQFTYADGTRALEPVSLRIAPGEFVALVGPSGCGKSTLLKMMSGLLAPSAGELRVRTDGRDGTRAKGAAIAFVFQAPTLMPWAPVHANVRLPLDLANMPRQESRRRVDEALALVGLTEFAGALPRGLSGGMQMRASIARGLVTHPSILLMDEPFGALDEITRQDLDGELLHLWTKHRFTVVFVTHSIHEAVFLSERVIVLTPRPGRIVGEVRIDEPYPRDADFTFSANYSELARRVQHCLHRVMTSNGAQPAPAHDA